LTRISHDITPWETRWAWPTVEAIEEAAGGEAAEAKEEASKAGRFEVRMVFFWDKFGPTPSIPKPFAEYKHRIPTCMEKPWIVPM